MKDKNLQSRSGFKEKLNPVHQFVSGLVAGEKFEYVFEGKANLEKKLENHVGRKFLLKLLENYKGISNIFDEDNILNTSRQFSLEARPSSYILDQDEYFEGCSKEDIVEELRKTESGLGGDRWQFGSAQLNEFLTLLFETVAEKFNHNLALNDLYHTHIVHIDYIEFLKFGEMGFIFHAKEAPVHEHLNRADPSGKLAYYGNQFSVNDGNVRYRNVIYLLESNRMVAFDNQYNGDSETFSSVNDLATQGQRGAESKYEAYRSQSDSDVVKDEFCKAAYDIRPLSPWEFGKMIGDVNIIMPTCLSLLGIETEKPLLYLLTNKIKPKEQPDFSPIKSLIKSGFLASAGKVNLEKKDEGKLADLKGLELKF